ncbi:MAG: GTPase ObgE [Verrucomicrobiota bacterium]
MFVDRVRIWARGGKGGNGCSSFRREKFVPKGGPDGGDGGNGGSVVVKVNPHLNNLTHLKYKPHHFADKGQHGKGSDRTGRKGKPKTIEIPPGTVILRLPAPKDSIERSVPFEMGEQIADMTESEKEFVLCRGGRGGRGNAQFKTPQDKAPKYCEPGADGEYGQYAFELKSIADVGLVGYPNAGKSSLLRHLSAASPKVAPYPFTTLSPVVGIIEDETKNRFSMADIPGLIEGASEGVGLGHDFLRHIERCSLLVFVIDMSGLEGRNPLDDFAQLRKEIRSYDASLAEREFLIAANKVDLEQSQEQLKPFKQRLAKYTVIPISTETGEGTEALVEQLFERLKVHQTKEPESTEATPHE